MEGKASLVVETQLTDAIVNEINEGTAERYIEYEKQLFKELRVQKGSFNEE